MKVSQMGSQTSTDKIGGDKGTQNSSIIEQSNMGGAHSLEIGMVNEEKLNESIDSARIDKGEHHLASVTADVAVQKSIVDGEGNSSIDMPSF